VVIQVCFTNEVGRTEDSEKANCQVGKDEDGNGEQKKPATGTLIKRSREQQSETEQGEDKRVGSA
jgi:hypothetical protein